MTIMTNKNMSICGYLALLVCSGAVFQASAAESENVTFNMSVPNPTCNVSVTGGGIVSLGELTATGQEQTHNNKKFTITANCDGVGSASRNALTAQVLNSSGSLQSDRVRVAVKMGNNAFDNTNGPFLKIKNGSTDVQLNNSTTFCRTSNSLMNCELTPVTSVFKGAPTGEGTVIIRFNVSYPT